MGTRSDGCSALDEHRALAEAGRSSVMGLPDLRQGRALLDQALLIRAVENCLLDLFGQGRLHGTIHTCVGQEFTGVALANCLASDDFITSNHRCHGHFIAATGNWRGLIDEIVGNTGGVCAGIGSSQHLYAPNFLSNGPQGALLPVAAGVGLDRARRGTGGIAVSFIGEGTLGEGILYETLNLDCLWSIPHLIVCENNGYSQSTPQSSSVAGDIGARAAAFGAKVFKADSWDVPGLLDTMAEAVRHVREGGSPAFLVIKTYRLNPHSKGDDQRDREEIAWFAARDPVNVALAEDAALRARHERTLEEIRAYIQTSLQAPRLALEDYLPDQLPSGGSGAWTPYRLNVPGARVHERLNGFFRDAMDSDPRCWFLGEDIADPYGGAFKISRGLTTAHPDRALTTPISEAALVGVAIGLAISGNRAWAEIMFGDFMTYAFDQIVSNASKMHHMYNKRIDCPVVVRAPMGGRRGYGPTHSQSLERFFVGIDNCLALALNSLSEPSRQIGALDGHRGPAILFENKVDYTLRLFEPPEGYAVELDDAPFPTTRVRPVDGRPNVTIFAYGGMAREVCDRLLALFDEEDLLAEVIVPACLHPLDVGPVAASVATTGRLIVAEEGASFASIGAELVARLAETLPERFDVTRIGAPPVPIPSVPELERAILPGAAHLAEAFRCLRKDVAA